MSINYHMEALRQQRRNDRAFEARERLEKKSTAEPPGLAQITAEEGLVIADAGQYELRTEEAWKGTTRNRNTFDHSVNGPLMPHTWLALKRDLNFREKFVCACSPDAHRPKTWEELRKKKNVSGFGVPKIKESVERTGPFIFVKTEKRSSK